MKIHVLALWTAVLALGQSAISRVETDINGRRVETSSAVSTDGTRTEVRQSLNGRPVPFERVEEKILSEGPGGKVVERIVRKFDQTGQPNGFEKVRIEEEKGPGGLTTVRETTWRTDLNGSLREAERRITETQTSGSTTRSSTLVARPDLSGSFSPAEKRSSVTETSGNREQTSETVQRPNVNGQFYDAVREVRVVEKVGEKVLENRASYEPDVNGRMELSRQAVSTSSKLPDGAEVTEVNLYGKYPGGRTQEERVNQVQEQQIIERRKAADGSTVETLSVRRPTVADPSRLGAPQKLSETVCQGKCQP